MVFCSIGCNAAAHLIESRTALSVGPLSMVYIESGEEIVKALLGYICATKWKRVILRVIPSNPHKRLENRMPKEASLRGQPTGDF